MTEHQLFSVNANQQAGFAVRQAGPAGSPAVRKALKQLRDTTGKIVGHLFYGTLLKHMRESKLKGAYGHGGRGEEVFAGQLDGILAERAGSATQNGLAETLYRTLEGQTRRISAAAAAHTQG